MSDRSGQAPAVTVTAIGLTDPGRVRKNNEDAFLVATLASMAGSVAPSGVVTFDADVNAVLLAVSDGMGGADAGEVASALVVQSLRDAMIEEKGDWDEATRKAVERANRDVWSAAKAPGRRGMGATLTVVCVQGAHAHIAEVGDSRAYLVRNGRIRQVTRDQSFVQMLLDSGALKPEEAESYPMKNVVLQAMGQKPDVQVAQGRLALRRGDRLLLCSDGLSKEVGADDMREVIDRNKTLDGACRALVALANARGGEDNITVVLAEVNGPGLPVPQDEESLTQTFKVLAEYKAAGEDAAPDTRDDDLGRDSVIAPRPLEILEMQAAGGMKSSPPPASSSPPRALSSPPPPLSTRGKAGPAAPVAGVKRVSLPVLLGLAVGVLVAVVIGLVLLGR